MLSHFAFSCNTFCFLEILHELQNSTSFKPKCHSRIIIVNHIPKHLKPEFIKTKIKTVTEKLGGVFPNGIFVPSWEQGQFNKGFAVIECRAGWKVDEFKTVLETIDAFGSYGEFDLADTDGIMPTLVISKVNENLDCADETCKLAWKEFLKMKLFFTEEERDHEPKLKIMQVLTDMFQGQNSIPLKKIAEYNKLKKFLSIVDPEEKYLLEIDEESMVRKH